jgi:acyl carrier protein
VTTTSDHTTCLDVVIEALAKQTGLAPEKIDPDQTIVSIPEIESIKVLRAMVQIEEHFAIVIPDDFLFEAATVRSLAAYVATLAGQT